MKTVKGFFMEPQNFSVNDGEGIRTIIFMAGCPLRCKWCSNPESFIQYNTAIKSSKTNFVFEYTTDEIIKKTEKQELFYRYSGGGVTFSGGEPTFQKEVLRDLVYKFYDKAIDMNIETCGYFNFDDVKDIFEKFSLVFIDLKHMDPPIHKKFTGVDNDLILSNIKKIGMMSIPIVIRIPLIEGVNATEENIRSIAAFLKENLESPKIELLPYHSFGNEKYEALGLSLPSEDFKTPTKEKIEILKKLLASEGIEIVSYS